MDVGALSLMDVFSSNLMKVAEVSHGSLVSQGLLSGIVYKCLKEPFREVYFTGNVCGFVNVSMLVKCNHSLLRVEPTRIAGASRS